MKRRSRGRWARVAAAVLAVLCIEAGGLPALAKEVPEKTLRVGFPLQTGFSEISENGTLSGYTYEYLQEIAQYTGWNYEFVTVDGTLDESLGEMLDMLERGEIDLLGAMNYSEGLAELYDYPAVSYGTAYSSLAVLDSNTAITGSDFASRNELRIAVVERAVSRNEQLLQFCEQSGITPELVYCQSTQEQLDVLYSGAAEAVLWMDVNQEKDLRVVARFAPNPFYFAATKGRSDIVSSLNSAIYQINETDPYFTVELYEKYFGRQNSDLHLTGEERAYIRGTDVLRVAVMTEKRPIEDMDENGEYIGISRRIFDYFTEHTGLEFQFVPARTSDELTQLLEEGTVDIAAGIPYDYGTAELYNVALTRPYLSTQAVLVLGKGVDVENLKGKRLAVAKGLTYSGPFMGEVTWYDTVPECIAAVERGEQDYCYGNGYIVQYYVNAGRYRNVTMVPLSNQPQRTCIGIAKPVDITLLTILNKAILSIPEGELQAMVYQNAIPQDRVTLASFVDDNPWTAVLAVAVLAALVIGALLIYFIGRIRLTRQSELESERYRQLSEMSNEHIFEYDFKKDRLTLTEKSARMFGWDRVKEHFYFQLRQDGAGAEQELALFDEMVREGSAAADMRLAMNGTEKRWYRVTVKLIRNREGRAVSAVGKLSDIQREREERALLVDQAQRDSLTGLYNAATTRQLVSDRLAKGGKGAMLIIDIDHFKSVNDEHGHYTGDRVLAALAGLLEQTFRSGDVLGRLGGDEFVVFMDRVTEANAVAVKCSQLLEQVEQKIPAKDLRVTVSIGAVMSWPGADYNALYQKTDRALYIVKKRGRNGFEILA